MSTADVIRANGRAELLAEQFALKFGHLDPAIRRTLATATLEQTNTWNERFIRGASSLADIFGDDVREPEPGKGDFDQPPYRLAPANRRLNLAEEVLDSVLREFLNEGRAALLAEQLTMRFGELAPATRHMVATATPAEINTWSGRLIRGASTLDDVFPRVTVGLGPTAEEVAMSTAQTLRNQGRAELLAELLTMKFGELSTANKHALATATPDEITAWSRRLVN